MTFKDLLDFRFGQWIVAASEDLRIKLVRKVTSGISHRQTVTFIAGLRCDGLTAPCVIKGAMDGDFERYTETQLAPTL